MKKLAIIALGLGCLTLLTNCTTIKNIKQNISNKTHTIQK